MAKYSFTTTRRFEKDLQRCIKRGLPVEDLWTVIRILLESGVLPPKYKSHKLKGDYFGLWECHIKSDWLLVWEQNDTELRLLFLYTGTGIMDIFSW